MIDLIILSKGLLLGYFITRFSPFSMILDIIPNSKSNIINLLLNIIRLLFSCGKCAVMWCTFTISKDLYISILASFLMVVIEKYLLEPLEQIKFINPYANKEE